MQQKKHIHCIGIWGIGISALARYYLSLWYRVTGTNMWHSPLLDSLLSEGIEIIENGAMMIDRETTKVIYTEAIIDDHSLGLDGVRADHYAEVQVARFYHTPLLSYPEALAELLGQFPIKIAVAWAHGKSTTSAMIGTVLHDNHSLATTITGTLVKAFWWKNICIEGDHIMVIEACEYRNAFLGYHPDIAVITNIDPDHLDFFKTNDAYYASFQKFMSGSRCVIMPRDEYLTFEKNGYTSTEGQSLHHNTSTLILVDATHFEILGNDFWGLEKGIYSYDLPKLLVPGDHIRIDASLAYVTSQLLGIESEKAKKSLVSYPGSWRRMEIIGTTKHNNLLMSDYGHHPTEIIATLGALRERYPDRRLLVFFEPHQYSRTYELLEEFATSFTDADMAYIVDIYAARDIDARREKINSQILTDKINAHSPATYAGSLDATRTLLQTIDEDNSGALLLLLGAGTIDELRGDMETM